MAVTQTSKKMFYVESGMVFENKWRTVKMKTEKLKTQGVKV